MQILIAKVLQDIKRTRATSDVLAAAGALFIRGLFEAAVITRLK